MMSDVMRLFTSHIVSLNSVLASNFACQSEAFLIDAIMYYRIMHFHYSFLLALLTFNYQALIFMTANVLLFRLVSKVAILGLMRLYDLQDQWLMGWEGHKDQDARAPT